MTGSREESIAALLASCVGVKQAMADLEPQPGSALEADLNQFAASTAKAGARAFFLADLWLLSASLYTSGLGALVAAGAALLSPLPILRSALEMCAGVVTVADLAIDSQTRAARACILEAYGTAQMRTAAKRVHGETSLEYTQAKQRVIDLKRAAELDFSVVLEGNPEQWNLGGTTLPSPSSMVESLGAASEAGRVTQGTYDLLSAFSHAGLGPLLLLDRDPDGRFTGGITMPADETERLSQLALGAFYVAASRFVMYAGASMPPPLDALGDRAEAVFPGFFTPA